MAAQSTSLTTIATPSDREIVTTRVFDAPRQQVFEAWTKPEHVTRWWGPLGSTISTCNIDLRPGGEWRFVVRTADGAEHPFKGVYREIRPPERLVYTFVYDVDGLRDHEAVVTMALAEREGGTTMTETIVHRTVEARDGHLQSMKPGAEQTLDRLAEHLKTMPASGAAEHPGCPKIEPQKEHHWLRRLAGDWTFEGEALMGPDQPPAKMAGSETVRAVGDLWIVGEGRSETPDGGTATTMVTLGYDPGTKRFVGTFIASMMTHLWIYNGALNESETLLTLDTEGPDMSGGGKMVKYRDLIELVSDDHRILRSEMPGPDGNWLTFMTAHYRRRKG